MAGHSLLGHGQPDPSLTCTDISESFANGLAHIVIPE